MDERVDFVALFEGIGNEINESLVNEHINKYLLNENLVKEICSYMNPVV
jgi:hypothetical protein